MMLAHFCSMTIRLLHTEKSNESRTVVCATAATKKKDVATKRLRTRSTFRQSLMASVGESQVVDKTPVWYLSITESMLLRAVIVTWCCYNSSCPPYVKSQASSSFFQQDITQHTWCLKQSTCQNTQLFTRHLPLCSKPWLHLWRTSYFRWPNYCTLQSLLLPHSSTSLYTAVLWFVNCLYHCYLYRSLQTWLL